MHAQHIDFLDLLDGQVQYIVPRWQRRYRWGQADIERLVEDLLTVAIAGPEAAHYGGTLLTFSGAGTGRRSEDHPCRRRPAKADDREHPPGLHC